MADFVFNAALGRAAQLYDNVLGNNPANSVLVVVALASAGLETDAVLRDKNTLADVLAGTTNEVTNSGYARKVLTDASLIAYDPDTNDRVDLDIPDQTWTAVLAGDGWAKLVICYDPDSTTGTDSTLIPITCQDFAITPDGSDVVAQINSAGFYRAAAV